MQSTPSTSGSSSWLRPSTDFVPSSGSRPGGSAPEMQFFVDSAGERWLGKCGTLALYNRRQLLQEVQGKPEFISPYADEILEKLGLAIYDLVRVEVPQSALSYQPVTEEVAKDFDCHSPRMHCLSKYLESFRSLEEGFVEEYLEQAKGEGVGYVKTQEGERLPLRGLGAMLAAADFLYDLDCIGNRCGNAGYVIREEERGRYAQLVKIDAGYAFSYYEARYDQKHDPRTRNIRIAPNLDRLQYSDLTAADQREFAITAKRILQITREEFAHLFAQSEQLEEGIPPHHARALLDGLIARKGLFLAAFAREADQRIVEEIEAARAAIARELGEKDHDEEEVRGLIKQDQQEARAQEELRVRLAVFDTLHGIKGSGSSCQTFQLPACVSDFVGREEVLDEISEQLSQKQGSIIGQSISGLGGVGKTQVALQYAHAAAQGKRLGREHIEYDYVIWECSTNCVKTKTRKLERHRNEKQKQS